MRRDARRRDGASRASTGETTGRERWRRLRPVLYEQPMQRLEVPHSYRTIYIPCGSFVCVMDRRLALEALRRCHAHLEPGGTLAFNVFLADHDYSGRTPSEPFPRPWQKVE